MNAGLRRLNKLITHSKLSDYYFCLEQMDIDGERENSKDQYYIEKLNPAWVGTRTALNKRKLQLNREDESIHGHDKN